MRRMSAIEEKEPALKKEGRKISYLQIVSCDPEKLCDIFRLSQCKGLHSSFAFVPSLPKSWPMLCLHYLTNKLSHAKLWALLPRLPGQSACQVAVPTLGEVPLSQESWGWEVSWCTVTQPTFSVCWLFDLMIFGRFEVHSSWNLCC